MNACKIIEMMEQIRDHAQIIDLSYTLEPNMPAWPTQARYGTIVYESYEFGDPAIHSMISMSEHTGTHIDAPRHFIPGARPVDQLELKTVMGRGVYIEAAGIKPKGLLTLEQIHRFEQKNGEIREHDIVMIRFGWDKNYALAPDCEAYLKDWPGLAAEAAEYFQSKNVSAVGCDTLSLDAFGSDNPCHRILLGHGIPIIENLCNLSKLPVFSYVIGMPNKFKGGSGSPIRIAALIGSLPQEERGDAGEENRKPEAISEIKRD